MLFATFRMFQFCPCVNKPSVGNRACFSHAEKTKSGQTDPTRLCCGDETRILLNPWPADQAWFVCAGFVEAEELECRRMSWKRVLKSGNVKVRTLFAFRTEVTVLECFSATQSNVQKNSLCSRVLQKCPLLITESNIKLVLKVPLDVLRKEIIDYKKCVFQHFYLGIVWVL